MFSSLCFVVNQRKAKTCLIWSVSMRVILGKGSRSGLRSRGCVGDQSRKLRLGRTHRCTSHQRDYYVSCVCEVGSKSSRFAFEVPVLTRTHAHTHTHTHTQHTHARTQSQHDAQTVSSVFFSVLFLGVLIVLHSRQTQPVEQRRPMGIQEPYPVYSQPRILVAGQLLSCSSKSFRVC